MPSTNSRAVRTAAAQTVVAKVLVDAPVSGSTTAVDVDALYDASRKLLIWRAPSLKRRHHLDAVPGAASSMKMLNRNSGDVRPAVTDDRPHLVAPRASRMPDPDWMPSNAARATKTRDVEGRLAPCVWQRDVR